MSHQSFGKDVTVNNSSNESNTIVDLNDVSADCVSTTQLQDYLDILNTLSNDSTVDSGNTTKISNDLSSDKIKKPKIWSISDILENSSDECTNKISSVPAEEISHTIPTCVPGHSNIQNQIVEENGIMDFNNVNLDANNFIDKLSQLNMSLPNFVPAITSIMPIESALLISQTDHAWFINGIQCSYIEMVYQNFLYYLCGTCRLRFDDKEALRRHQFNAHVSPGMNNGDSYCSFCGVDQKTYQSLQRHHKRAHPYSCFFCHVEFPSQLDFTQHIMTYHPHPNNFQVL